MKITKSRVQQIIKEEVSRFLSERISMQDGQWAMDWREQLPDIIRKAGGKLHQGDLLDHGLKGTDINRFMGIIKMSPDAGEFLDGPNAGTKIVQSNDYLMIEEGLVRESMSYGDAMTQVDQIMAAIRDAGEINWDQTNALLSIVGDDGSWETDEARSAIHSIEDEGTDALYDAENYIRDALRAQGR